MKATPAQLAEALLTFVPDLKQVQKGLRQMHAIRDMMNEACEDTYARAPFWEESAALYLLDIIKSFSAIDLSGPSSGLGGYQAQWLEGETKMAGKKTKLRGRRVFNRGR